MEEQTKYEKEYKIGMAVCAGILFVLSLIPILALGKYNVMCIDDYDYGRRVHDTWIATGSLLQSMQTAWQQSMYFYKTWQGTFVSCFLMGMCPMNFHYEIAYMVPIIMVSVFVISTFVLEKHILCKWIGADKAGSIFVIFMLLFMYYQVMESPFEGIYWYNGALHYVFMESVLFFCLTAISASLRTENKARAILLCIVSMVLSLIVSGGNLVTGLQAEIVMALLILYTVVTNRKKIILAAAPFIMGSIGFLFNIMAPGNAQRSQLDMDTGYSVVMSILLSFYHALSFMIRWTPAFVMLIWLMMLPVLWKMVKKSTKSFSHPVWVTLGAVCLIAAMFTPTLFAVGAVGLSRVDNIIQMVYYLCLITVTAYWLGYFAHRESVFGMFLEKAGYRMTAAFLFISLIVWTFTADKNTYTSISALRSLVKGEAQTFYAQALERYEIYTDETITEVELKPYSVKPVLFDFEDLTRNPDNWLNGAVTGYYHKVYVIVVDE